MRAGGPPRRLAPGRALARAAGCRRPARQQRAGRHVRGGRRCRGAALTRRVCGAAPRDARRDAARAQIAPGLGIVIPVLHLNAGLQTGDYGARPAARPRAQPARTPRQVFAE